MVATSATKLGHIWWLLTTFRSWRDLQLSLFTPYFEVSPCLTPFACAQIFGRKVADDSPNLYEKVPLFYLNCCFFFYIKDEQKQRANYCTKKPEYRDIETAIQRKGASLVMFCSYQKLATGVHTANTGIAIKC